MEWTIGLTQDWDWWRAFVNMTMNLRPFPPTHTQTHTLSLSLSLFWQSRAETLFLFWWRFPQHQPVAAQLMVWIWAWKPTFHDMSKSITWYSKFSSGAISCTTPFSFDSLTNQALCHEGVWGSGCTDPRFLSTSVLRPCRFTPSKEPSIPIGWEAGWAPEPIWTARRKFLTLSELERPSLSCPAYRQSLYQLCHQDSSKAVFCSI
jgi:hypothetical protein